MTHFKCLLPAGIEFGPGKIGSLSDILPGGDTLLLTDKGVAASGIVDKVAAQCQAVSGKVHQFMDIPPEPSEDQVTEVVAKLSELNVSAIVALGGGSVMDMAKLVGVMLNGGPTMQDLFDGKLPRKRDLPLIMIPTTAGTGSEATPNAIVYRPSQQLKVGIVCDAFMPDRVILDPELTTGLPAAITASTGMDALCHALECYISNKANLLSDVLAVEATRLIFKSLKKSYTNGGDLEARADMLLASFYAGICIASSGTNGVHALSYPLGGRYRIPHGVSNAVLLAPVFAANKDACVSKLASIAPLCGKSMDGTNDEQKADIFVQALEELSRDLGIPAHLSELGVPAEDLDDIVEAALQVKRLLDNNPKTLTREDIRAIYTSIL
jgi:alcohol dehydrogenase class IV